MFRDLSHFYQSSAIRTCYFYPITFPFEEGHIKHFFIDIQSCICEVLALKSKQKNKKTKTKTKRKCLIDLMIQLYLSLSLFLSYDSVGFHYMFYTSVCLQAAKIHLVV